MPVAAGVAAAAVPLALGVLVLARSTQRRIGGLLLAHGLSVAAVLGVAALPLRDVPALVVAQLTQGSWVFLFLWMTVAAYLLPDGRPLSPRWRAWVGAGLVGAALVLVGAPGDASGFARTHGGAALPVGWLPEPVSGALGVLGLGLVVALLFASVPAVGVRLRRATGEVRLQLLWLVWGASSVPLVLMLLWADYVLLGGTPVVDDVLVALGSVLPSAAIAVAVLRHRLFDIRPVLRGTLLYGALSLLVVGVYAVAMLAAERLVGSATLGGAVAVVTVAVGAAPVVERLHRRISRWVYGDRPGPSEALRLLARRVEAADEDRLRDSVTDAVADVLRVERARIEATPPAHGDGDGDRDGGGVLSAPLVHRGQVLGHLVVDLPPGRGSAVERGLLADLARYTAVLVWAERLNADLRASRTGIVAAREEERRRLRRDLHDGVGPSLAAMVLSLNAAQGHDDAAARDALIAQTRAEVRATIVEVRRLVEGLQPAAVDQVGLLGAIRQRAASVSGGIAVEVSGPHRCPPLPAAVEVAAFRIASEAITNVARHSGASRCRVLVAVDGERLALTVEDNGRGLGSRPRRGVGWESMLQRAAEVGGSCEVARRADGGVLVRAVLPLRSGSAAVRA